MEIYLVARIVRFIEVIINVSMIILNNPSILFPFLRPTNHAIAQNYGDIDANRITLSFLNAHIPDFLVKGS